MDAKDLQTLFEFNAWANRRILDACEALAPEQFTRDLGSSFGSVRDTLVHTFGAEWIWLERFHGRNPTAFAAPSDFPNVAAVRRKFEEVDAAMIDYTKGLTTEKVAKTFAYKTMAGAEFSQPLWECLQHLANHGTYHRGQVTTMLRQLKAKAVSTDLIAFYRERAAARASA